MVSESVLNSVRKYLRALQDEGVAVKFGVIFGSQLTCETDTRSDIDLIVVSPSFDDRHSRDDINLIWRLAAQTDNRIEPIPCGERQWLEDGTSTIITDFRRAITVIY